MDTATPSDREFTLTASSSSMDGVRAIVFAGERVNEPMAWRGTFVLNTDEEGKAAMARHRAGTLLVKRAPWDYKRLAAFPTAKSS